MMTYCEFGRRPKENQSGGTDHGTANAHFVLGGRVKGGLYGLPPALTRLDGNGNLPFAVDFRDLYATALERWWGLHQRSAVTAEWRDLVHSRPVDVIEGVMRAALCSAPRCLPSPGDGTGATRRRDAPAPLSATIPPAVPRAALHGAGYARAHAAHSRGSGGLSSETGQFGRLA